MTSTHPLSCSLALALLAAPLASSGAADPAAGPRAAARAYFEALLRGDAEAALAIVVDPTEADRVAVRASAASESALRYVESVATERFGAQGNLGVAARHARLLAAIGRAPAEVKGDRALLRPESERPVHLRRIAGAWKIASPADRLTGEERKAIERALDETESVAKDLADRIRASAVRSAEEAREALRKALGKREPEGVPL
jgi:hypothetical protein